MDKRIGNYSFTIGVVIAIILGLSIPALANVEPILVSLLLVLGLIVGFLNVAGKESKEFLTVVAVLAIVLYVSGGSGLGQIQYIGPYICLLYTSPSPRD